LLQGLITEIKIRANIENSIGAPLSESSKRLFRKVWF
jgi:hypothetical protein